MRLRISVSVYAVFLMLASASTASAQDCDGNGVPDAVELANAETRIILLTPPVGDGSEEIQERLGAAVDIDGDVAIAGAPGNRTQFAPGGELVQGRAVVYRRTNGVWAQEQVLFSDQLPFTREFGRHVAIEGDVAVVGASSLSGISMDRMFVFRFANGTWSMEADILLPSKLVEWPNFGRSIDISGDTIMVGMGGLVQFYEFQGGSWQATETVGPGTFSPTRSIAIDGDTAVVGAWSFFEININGAIVLQKLATGWEPVQALRDPLAANFSDFADSVDIDGDRIVLSGADSPIRARGAVVYQRQPDGSFQFETRLEAPDLSVTQEFGREVRISGSRIAVCYAGPGPTRTARLFELSAGAWRQVGDFVGSPLFGIDPTLRGAGVALNGDGLIVANEGFLTQPSRLGDATIYDLSATDCDVDGELDRCALLAADPDGDGQSALDCDGNGRLDSCELAERDCNGNGILDACDLGLVNGNAISDDCNGDLVPDDCQLAEMDCNGNGTLDECDLGFVAQLLDIPVMDNELNEFFPADYSTDIDGNILVVGVPKFDGLNENEGRAWVFELQDSRWRIKQVLQASAPVEFGEFGADVSISGDELAILHPRAATQQGSSLAESREIYMYHRVNDVWELDDVLTAADVVPDGNDEGGFGTAINLTQGRLVSAVSFVVAQPREIAAVFERIEGQGWVLDDLLSENMLADVMNGLGGVEVDQVGDTVLVSATRFGTPFLSVAAVFKRSESGYQQTALLTNPDIADDRNFGGGRMLNEDQFVVRSFTGATGYRGGIYLYVRDGAGWRLSDSILNPGFGSPVINRIGVASDDLLTSRGFEAAFDIVGDRFRRRLDNRFTELALLVDSGVMSIEHDGVNLVFGTLSAQDDREQIGVAPLFAPLDCNRNDLPDSCDAAGDLNGDLVVTLDDIPGFVDRLLTNRYCSLADFNSDDSVDGRDIAPFVGALAMP